MDSAGSYDPCLGNYRGYTDYGETGKCSDICLRSDMGSNREEDTPMEVEEDPHRDFPSHSEAKSSESEEHPAPKAPPRARHPGASRLPQVASREASSPDEDTPPPKVKSPIAHGPTPKPRGGKKAAAPVPVPEPGNTASALADAHAPKLGQLPKPARDTPCQAGWSPTQQMTGGLAGVPSPFPGLFNVCGGVHVPVPFTVPVPIILNVPVTLFPFMSVPINVCVPVSVIVLVPGLPPAALLALAHGGLLLQRRLLALVSGLQPDRLAHRESWPLGGALPRFCSYQSKN
ncbi:hypothetical protein P4O66_000656 [Electrophorus voltai]|uniref:Uncharacterized protein n=1 Tax=Electrophorus voltai TaxID=2609070 RepID=A0AAD8ZET5_9TELE|nr:hypothetical protein P4O66_000656 [Electrophorus voltai]